MEFLSERVSMERAPGRLSVVISARLSRGREAMLLAWYAAWSFCGIYVLYAFGNAGPGRERQFMLAFLAFWLYFMVRIGRVVLWRMKGFESIRVKDGVLTIKNSIFGRGKANDHFVENITRLGLLEIDRTSWKWQLNESFWVMGAERLVFESGGRNVIFGKGLNDEEARQVLALIKTALTKERKAAQ